MGNGHCPKSHRGPMCYGPENTKPGKLPSTGICNGTFHWDRWVTLHPWVRGNRIPFSNCQPDLFKHTICSIERREKAGALVWHVLPPVHPSRRPALPPTPANVHCMCNEVKFQNLPASFSSRQGGHVLFSTAMTIAVCILSIALENVIAHTWKPLRSSPRKL